MPKLPRSLYLAPNLYSINQQLQQMMKYLNGNISFGQTALNQAQNATPNDSDHSDIACWKWIDLTPGVANTEFAVPHNLPWIPWFFFYFMDKPGDIYKSTTTWTKATSAGSGGLNPNGNIYVKSTATLANYTMIII